MVDNYEFISENGFDINFLSEFPTIKTMNSFERCLLRMYHRYFIANYAQQQTKRSEENRTILVSRSIYDSFAYIDVYGKQGAFSESEFDVLNKVKNAIEVKPYTIILNPSVEKIMQRLQKRTDFHERDDRKAVFSKEDTVEFVTLLHDSFEKMKDYENVLYIEDNDESSVKKILEWLKSK